MSIRTTFALLTGRITKRLLTTFTGGGSSLPGKIALKISPNIIKDISQHYDVIIITGTNGKTLTTRLITNIFKKKYNTIVSNIQGSNMVQGIAGAFIEHKNRTDEKKFAILEVDEGTLNKVVEDLNPKYIIHTNLFLDQADRYGDVTKTYELLVNAAKKVPDAILLQNGDLPLFNTVELPNERKFFGVDTPVHPPKSQHHCPKCGGTLSYKTYTYSRQGNYYCKSGNFKRPILDYKVTDIIKLSEESSTFRMDDATFKIPVAGLYNIYNALAAYSVAKEYDINNEDIKSALLETERVFGRQERINIYGHTATLNVVKNPVGLNQVLTLIEAVEEPMTLVALLNNRPADGVDVSWLRDGNFESLLSQNITTIKTGGISKEVMTERLVEAGFNPHIIKEYDNLEKIVEDLKHASTDNIQIIASYTAMLEFRKVLKDKKII
uniref:MurT ligase domain-containing protein n=1 Tax=Nosocomiicoccus ampullae TaxID=489910 RepID=UPI00082A26A1|nr:MurT ligase domain-containing protein [Nosocomiicoccus ampullae]